MVNLGQAVSPALRGEVSLTPAVTTLARVPMAIPGGAQIMVAPTIYREWVSLSRSTTATGQSVQAALGWPLEDFSLPSGAEVVYFERGAIILRPDGRAFAVYGTIYLHYRDLFDLKTGAGFNVGLPITEEEAVTGGRRSRFDNADIYWNAARNEAFEVHGAIRDKWYALGGYSGFLGYPLTDESRLLRNGAEIGRYNHFAGGTIFWSPNTGAFETHGAIRDMYLHSYNGPIGGLGFPLTDETGSPGGGRRYNNFEHGCIVWTASNGALNVYKQLDIFVQNINGSGSHTFFEEIGTSSVWLYAKVNVATNTGINQNLHLPPNGNDYGHPSASPGTIYSISPVRGDMTVMLTLDGWDHCISTSDAHLGTLRATFNVDNDFGVNQPRHIDDGDFHGDLDMRRVSIDNPNDPNFRRAEFWGWQNVGTTTLSRQQYAETFVDVESSESDFHWFDDFFYNNFFKGIANGGNCFGMCVESIYAERNSSLFSEPIFPLSQAQTIYEINKKQAYQLGASYLDWFVANFLALRFWDPATVYHDSKAAWDCGDYPVICITDATRGSGHCVRPVGPNAYTETATQYIIEVANPNAPGTNGSDAASRIVIDKASNTYSIAIWNGGPMWTGGKLTGGIMSWAPFSVLCREPRTPFWEVLAAAIGAALIVLGDGATTTQMTDNNGHVLYKADKAGVSNRWDDLATDSSAIPGLARIPLSAAFLSHGPIVGTAAGLTTRAFSQGPELYRVVGLASPYGPAPSQSEFVAIPLNANMASAVSAAAAARTFAPATPSAANGSGTNGNAGSMSMVSSAAARVIAAGSFVGTAVRPLMPPSTITAEVSSGGTYSWGLHTLNAAVVANVTGSGGGNDQLTIDKIGAVDQTITLKPPASGTRQAQVVLRSRSVPSATPSVFVLDGVALGQGNAFSANVLPDGKTLQIQNHGGQDAHVQVTLQSGTGAATAAKALPVPAGKTATIAPADWTALPTTQVTAQIRSAPGGAVENSISL
jgi:uncharacterized protein with LGFP repeats